MFIRGVSLTGLQVMQGHAVDLGVMAMDRTGTGGVCGGLHGQQYQGGAGSAAEGTEKHVHDSAQLEVRGYGVLGGQPSLAVPSMHAKVRAQCAAGLLVRCELVEKRVANPREPNLLYVAWRGDHQGKALDW